MRAKTTKTTGKSNKIVNASLVLSLSRSRSHLQSLTQALSLSRAFGWQNISCDFFVGAL